MIVTDIRDLQATEWIKKPVSWAKIPTLFLDSFQIEKKYIVYLLKSNLWVIKSKKKSFRENTFEQKHLFVETIE